MSEKDLLYFNDLLDEHDRLVKQQNQTSERMALNNLEIRAVTARIGTAAPNGTSVYTEDLEERWRRFVIEKQRLAYATAGAAQLKLTTLPNGDYEATIDSHVLRLAPRVGDLLRALAEPSGESADRFVGWKSRSHLQLALAVKAGVPISRRGLAQLTHRLRKVLQNHKNLHEDFVQKDRRRGLRFALQKLPPEG